MIPNFRSVFLNHDEVEYALFAFSSRLGSEGIIEAKESTASLRPF